MHIKSIKRHILLRLTSVVNIPSLSKHNSFSKTPLSTHFSLLSHTLLKYCLFITEHSRYSSSFSLDSKRLLLIDTQRFGVSYIGNYTDEYKYFHFLIMIGKMTLIETSVRDQYHIFTYII